MENGFLQSQNDDGSIVNDVLSTHTPEQLEEEKQLRRDAELAFRPGYLTVPIDEAYLDPRLNDGDILLLSFILGFLKNNPKIWLSSEKLLLIARKATPGAIDKQLTKLHSFGYIVKTTRTLIGGGKQRVITLPNSRKVQMNLRKGSNRPLGKVQTNPSIYNISNLSNTNLVHTVKTPNPGTGGINSYKDVPESEALIPTPSGAAPLPFENFWRLYPRKVAKASALKAFGRLTKQEQVYALDALPKHQSQVDWQKEGGKFIPHAATWLNAKRWEDELEVDESTKPTPEQIKEKEERNQKLFSQTREQRAEIIKNLNKQNE